MAKKKSKRRTGNIVAKDLRTTPKYKQQVIENKKKYKIIDKKNWRIVINRLLSFVISYILRLQLIKHSYERNTMTYFISQFVDQIIDIPLYKIGQKYIKRNKRKDICTVVDILYVFNNAGELVKYSYVTTHEFMGQIVTEHDVNETSIKMALVINGKVLWIYSL